MAFAVQGIGCCLPPFVDNSHWPDDVVASWRQQPAPPLPPQPWSRGLEATLSAMRDVAGDPFGGCKRRGVLPDGMSTADLETEAVKEACLAAGVSPDSIDFYLWASTGPINLVPGNAYEVHARLGMSTHLFTANVDTENNTFLTQLTMANALLGAGYKRGLLVQSSHRSHLIDADSRHAPLFGDGACAAIVTGGRSQVLAESHRTDSDARNAYTVGEKNRWWNEKVRLRETSPALLFQHFCEVVEISALAAEEAIEGSGCSLADVDHLVSHQPMQWFPCALAKRLGIARYAETFARFGSLGGANIPLCLWDDPAWMKPDAVSLLASGGAGRTWSSIIVRW